MIIMHFNDDEIKTILMSLKKRKSFADGRKGYKHFPEEKQISEDIAAITKRFKEHITLPNLDPPVIVDIIGAIEPTRAKDTIIRWCDNEPCIFGCGPMKQDGENWRVCEKCDFKQWSNVVQIEEV